MFDPPETVQDWMHKSVVIHNGLINPEPICSGVIIGMIQDQPDDDTKYPIVWLVQPETGLSQEQLNSLDANGLSIDYGFLRLLPSEVTLI